ncbi:hypothetical protein HELRODRAFT_108942 [Helobdella robusta]|uniref:Ubiquitin-protein ligase E3C n=1 Tax=Helobdella robusta TaxID=6412 RepID=T1EEP1_HELRO|nr:hypothetical protein HELRODRAFT_108942 [Helobdella robusta]ESO11703.1 hypothetical protein HELRODRAFT_108942 [Helobdella robusta]
MLQYDRKLIVHKFRLLNVLSFNPYFIERVWLLISSIHFKSVLNEKTYLLQWIARGSNLVGEDFRRIIPLVSTLSIIFNYYLLTISDAEFHGKRGTKKVMPFNNLQAVSQLALALRDFCLGVIELSHPESRTLMINYNRLSHNMATRVLSSTALKSRFTALTSPTAALTSQAAALTSSSPIPSYSERSIMRQRELLYVFKDAVKLLKQLYERDCRESYCPAGSWLASSNLYHSEKFIQPLSSTASVFVGCAFGTLSILNSDEASLSVDQPILSTSEVRKLIILSELPFVISFQDRVKIFHDLVRRDKMENQPDHAGLYGNTIIIRRNYIYEDAFEKLSPENEPNLKGRLQIKLINAAGLDEAGVDGGGLFREFMSELVKTGFDPNLGFFKMTPDKLLYPNFQSNLIWKDDYLKHYFFLGRVLGKVIYENMLIEVPFASFFLAKLLSRHKGLLDMHYLASLDPELHRNLLFIKDYEGDVLDMQLDFTVNYEVLGQLKVDELKPNGRNIQVTNSNRYEYMYLMADYKLNRQIRQHCSAFRAGLADVLNISWLRMFDHNELQILISGANVPIDVDDLRRNCNYSGGYTVGHPVIQMFWQVVEDFDDSQRQQLLKFVTSCSRPPLMGFKELYPPFCIHHAGTDLDRLPTSSTCMNLLKLPEFKDKGSLKQKLLYAIESGAGFELS